MPVSRLRVAIAAWFAVAFLVGLGTLDLSLYAYLRVQADRRLTNQLATLGTDLIQAVQLELAEAPDSGLAYAATETLREWVAPPGAYLVLDSLGHTVAERGAPGWLEAARRVPLSIAVWDGSLGGKEPVRRLVVEGGHAPRFAVALLASSLQSEEETEALAWWLAISLPVVLLLGLGGGYLLSRRALRPIRDLQRAIAGITPDRLRERLPVQSPSDEVDGVRKQFNTLLERLEAAQEGNRRFLRQAAHQIRTPLTLVMGEASLALQGDAPPERNVLDRILRASEQMQRRVGDLFVLAEAQAGSPIPLDDVVDLEELALEVADAARARARQLEHPLMFGPVEPLVVRGNRALLREALLELLENALRHSDPGSTIVLEVHSDIGVSVVSAGPAFDLPPAAPAGPSFEGRDHGLGLSIVQWIAALHGGGLTLQVERGLNRVTLALSCRAVSAS